MCQLLKSGKGLDEIFEDKKLKIFLSNFEILILEVKERQVGIGSHFEFLKKCWKDWFKAMNVKNAESEFFIQRNDVTDLT